LSTLSLHLEYSR